MGIPTFLLDAMAASGIDTDAPAPADAELPGGTDMTTINDSTARKLARKTLKGDVASAAEVMILLQHATLTHAQADLFRVVVSFSLADVAEAPTPAAKPRGSRATDGGTALASRVRKLADVGDRVNRSMRAKKLGTVDADLTVELVESLSDDECLALVKAPIRADATVVDLLADA